jgi:glucose/mannose-6-phosphate isomerase
MGSDGGEALRSAERLAGRGAVLYGCGVRAAAAVRLKNQINENAKAAAFAGALPEIAHNEVLGWVGHEREGLGMVAVFLRDEAETPGERVLADSVAELVEPDAAALLEWRGEGPDEVSRAFSLLALGDHVSCYLGQMEGVDLLDITRLQLLKRRLAGSG